MREHAMNDILSYPTSVKGNCCKPRIVAAKIKGGIDGVDDSSCEKPKVSGDLRVTENCMCHLRYAEVRSGHLLLYRYNGRDKECVSRIPLHNLNISLDSAKDNRNHITLSKFGDVTPIVTLQVLKESDYNLWIKTLVVEIIRQTPLNTLKFLDVLYISETLSTRQKSRRKQLYNKSDDVFLSTKSRHSELFQDREKNTLVKNGGPNHRPVTRRYSEHRIETETRPRYFQRDVQHDLPDAHSKCAKYINSRLTEEILEQESVSSLVRLLTKCQIDREYVPVREKKLLFESLSRFSFSVDNLKKRMPSMEIVDDLKPSKSLHNLHNRDKSAGNVKSIRSYFESFESPSNGRKNS